MKSRAANREPKQFKTSPEMNDQARRLYDYLLRYYAEHGWSPTVRQMQAEMGLTSTSMADYRLTVLEQWGWIERKTRGDRNIRPIRATERGLSAEQICRVYGWTQMPLSSNVKTRG